ncbi:uncharacterized protein BX664DRAFT_340416 [Halteromyces radiatus]|uniref:uncharacterized protein n=1 Tax=Halteromyces radiatus TaxID=101107 RepID=UPI00221FDE1C|nr:uncharacterized protein BX664DRAFT_340416 [Halteromyces radiatus]KAI8081449.1 hypothetical protein BX664DRAFT_340416 [Halteromyces radiatus]
MTTRNKILITGLPGIDTFQVVQGIFTSSGQKIPTKISTTVEEQQKQNDPIAGVIVPWTIDNKYYTASIDFWLDEPDLDSLTETIDGYGKKENGVTQVIDAFIYVFNKYQQNSFDPIKQWMSFLEVCDPSIRLCIGMSSSMETKATQTTTTDSSSTDVFEDWCLENQFDYIDMDQQPEIPMDKKGYDLVVDALHTNMWDGLVRKNGQTSRKLPDVFEAALSDNDDDNDDDFEQSLKNIEDDGEEWIKEIEKLKLEHDKLRKKDETRTLTASGKDILDFDNDDDDDDDDFDMPSKEEIGRMHDQLFGDIDQDDGLDKALQSLQAMREKGKDLPDEERRKMAAQVALSFAAQLGL